MLKGPLSVIMIGCLYIVAGVTGLVYHTLSAEPFNAEHIWILVIRLLAVVGGVAVLAGAGWARWLLATWIAGHVILSMWHTLSEVAMHGLLLALTAYCLFNPKASRYFRGE